VSGEIGKQGVKCMADKYAYLYTDGGKEKWAFCVVHSNRVTHEESGMFGLASSTNNDDTESEAILKAVQYAKEHPANYILITDSQAILDKINQNVANASGNPNIQGIRNILEELKSSPLPVSCALKYARRCSNEFMKKVDKQCQ
jgi:ribonuclease HI